ncbi:hypothetical protein D3C72_1837470 [compost metagenome]
MITNHRNVRPLSAATDFWPCSEEIALMTAKNTSGTAIILIRVTYSSPSGPNQVSAAGPSAQPASAPSTKPPTTRCQNGIRSQAETSFIGNPRG